MIEGVRNCIVSRSDLPLDPERLNVEPIVNWGGFSNRSFRITDGSHAFVLKLASSPDAIPGLERWRTFADRLTPRYHAPEMVAWIEAPELNTAGPLFDLVPGITPERLDQVPLAELVTTLQDLHHDRELAGDLAALGDRVTSCADAYRRVYHRRFTEDLDFVATAPPPFVSAHRIEWMRNEADRLAGAIAGTRAFDAPANAAVHGDVWLNNLIVGPTSFCILDWDGLELGDPAMDWAMLLGPTRADPCLLASPEATRLPLDETARERVHGYLRAALLDWIIDPLADWVQSWHEPFGGDLIREANERVHETALACYLEMYANSEANQDPAQDADG